MNEEREKELQKERFTSWADNGKACEGCMFATNGADKCSCEVYTGEYPTPLKPDNVFIDGETCKRYRERKK